MTVLVSLAACLAVVHIVARSTSVPVVVTAPGDAPAASLLQVGAFLLKVGALTFGGGLTMIAFMQEQVVSQFHWLTALVALASLVVLFRWKVSNPLLVAATAIIGLIAFPLLQPTWVFVK